MDTSGPIPQTPIHSQDGQNVTLTSIQFEERRIPTASAAVDRMIEAGILRESSGKRRGRLFLYESYLDILNRES